MRLIMQRASSNEDYDGDVDFICVELDEAVVKQLSELRDDAMRTIRPHNMISEVVFMDRRAHFCSRCPNASEDAERLLRAVDDADYVFDPAGVSLCGCETKPNPATGEVPHEIDTECDEVVFHMNFGGPRPPDIGWKALLKHADVTIETASPIPFGEIEKVVK